MKVLHVINSLSAGGAELHLLTLCRHLRGHSIDLVVACLRERVWGSRSLREEFEAEGVRVVRLGADARYDIRFPLRLLRLLREERPDILHTHLPRADLAGAVVQRFTPRLPWVCSVHNIYRKSSWSGYRWLPLLDRIWRRADAVIAISHAVREWLSTERGLPREAIEVIHYGVDPGTFAAPREDFRRRWNLAHRTIVGTMARLAPHKGHATLIRAMPAVRQALDRSCLVIVGYDTRGYRRELEALVETLGLGESVRLVGFQEDIASVHHAFDLFALASQSEGFGQVVIESMASGKAVVASRISPLTEIVVDGETGLLAEPGNPDAFAAAIIGVLQNPGKAAEMGARGRERVERYFSAARMAEQVLSIYRGVLPRVNEPNVHPQNVRPLA